MTNTFGHWWRFGVVATHWFLSVKLLYLEAGDYSGIPSGWSATPPRPAQHGHPSVDRRNEYMATVTATVGEAKYTVSQKNRPLLFFCDNFGKSRTILIFFTVKLRKCLRRKLKLKLPPPLKSVAALPCEM